MCTAPVTMSRADGTWTVRNTRPCAVSSIPLLPLRRCASSTSRSGSAATSAAPTKRWVPVATSVTTIAARRAARSALSAWRMSRRIHEVLVVATNQTPTASIPRGALLPPPERGRVGRGSRAARTASQRTPTPTLPLAGEGARVRAKTRAPESRMLLHLLHIDPDGAAAGEADLPGGLVGDAEFEHPGLAAVDHVERLSDHRT